MSRFSEQLQNFIDDRNVAIYVLAAESGVDRTLIHKMLKGERVPAERTMVDDLASALFLTPAETEALFQSYQITKMGETTYSRRKFIQDLFNRFAKISTKNNISISTGYHHQINGLPNDAAVYGNLEINNLVKTVIEMESIKKNGKIQIIVQPEYSFLFECLALVGMNHRDLEISHIVCLENSMKDSDGLYNLNCYSVMMPVLMSGCKYNPMCYYDHIPSHFSDTSMMPYMILTSDYVVNISYDLSYATISNLKPYLGLYNRIFENFVQKTMPMAKVLHSPIEHIEYCTEIAHIECCTGIIPKSNYENYDFTSDSCFLSFITKEMLHKYLSPSFPNRESLLSIIMQHPRYLQNNLKSMAKEVAYFSEEGLDKFLTTGRLTRVPEEYYSPFDVTDRYKLLRSLYDAALAGTYHPVLVNSALLNIPANLSTTSCRCGAVSFIYTVPNHEYTAFVITKKSISFAIQDFLDYLQKSNLVLSPEAALSLIKYKLSHEPKSVN